MKWNENRKQQCKRNFCELLLFLRFHFFKIDWTVIQFLHNLIIIFFHQIIPSKFLLEIEKLKSNKKRKKKQPKLEVYYTTYPKPRWVHHLLMAIVYIHRWKVNPFIDCNFLIISKRIIIIIKWTLNKKIRQSKWKRERKIT